MKIPTEESIIQPSPAPVPPAGMPADRYGERTKKRWQIAIACGAVLVGLYLIGTTAPSEQSDLGSNLSNWSYGSQVPDQPSFSSDRVQTTSVPSRTVESSGGYKLTNKSAYNCTAEAPSDWAMSSNQESNSADLYGSGKKLYAGYGIQAVNEQLAPFASAYQAPLNDPDLYSGDPATVTKAYAKVVIASMGGSTDVQYTSDYNQTFGDYSLRSISSGSHKGVIFFTTNGIAGDGVNYSYAEPMYFAITTYDLWESNGLLVAQIASGIKCNAQLVQHDGPVVKARTSGGSSASSDSNGSDAGYNPQLGTEYVHDSATGDNYLVSPSTNWSSDGPNGAGYYKQSGNDYTKLQPGRSD